MDNINRLIGGMNTDVHPSSQPENTTREVFNFVPMTENGNLFSMTNESGTTEMNVTFPDGFSVIGQTTLNSEIMVVLAHPSGYSQVGYIVEDGTLDNNYHPVAPYDELTESVPNDNNELGFTQAHPVDCTARKLIDGHRILYYTDNNIPFGRVDFDNPPLVGAAGEQSSLIPSFSTPDIQVQSVTEGGSGVPAGVYQFITRYVTPSGGTTIFGIPTNPVPMVPASKVDGVDDYEGGYNDATCNKTITLKIDNLDDQFELIEVVALYYEGDSSVFKATIVAEQPITDVSATVLFSTLDTENAIELSKAEIEQSVISYDRAKCIEQKDNTLFLSNLSIAENTDAIQAIANKVEVSYDILEIPFSERGSSDIASGAFTLTSLPYTIDLVTLRIPFSGPVDPVVVGDFNLYLSGGGTEAPLTADAVGNAVVLTFTAIDGADELKIESIITSDSVLSYIPPSDPIAISLTEPGGSSEEVVTGFTDYTEETLTPNKKGYRRGEVYSLGFVLLYKTGATSPVFHIPGRRGDDNNFGAGTNAPEAANAWPSFADSISSGVLGTYISSEEYPLGQSYPGLEPGDDGETEGPVDFERNIRHHYMPELANEPHFRMDSGSNQLIRVIGLSFEFTEALPQSVLDDVDEILFVRELRDKNANKSMYAQGLTNRMYVGASSFDGSDFTGKVTGGDQDTSEMGNYGMPATSRRDYVATPVPFFDNLESIGLSIANTGVGDGSIYRGFAYPGQIQPGTTGYGDGTEMDTTLVDDQGVFFSPETLLENVRLDEDALGLAKLQPALYIGGDIKHYNEGKDRWHRTSNNLYWLQRYFQLDMHCDYNRYTETDPSSLGDLTMSQSRFIKEQETPGPIDEGRVRTWNKYGTSALEFLLTDGDALHGSGGNVMTASRDIEFPVENNKDADKSYVNYDNSGTGHLRLLYNLKVPSSNQYSGIGTGRYVLIDRKPATANDEPVLTFSSIYGGDTFITKFAYINSAIVSYYPYSQKDASSSKNTPAYDDRHTYRWPNVEQTRYPIKQIFEFNGENITTPPGWDLRANNYYFVESEINTHYRHRGLGIDGELFPNGYFPNSDAKATLLNDFYPPDGNPIAYNPQYSFPNLVKNYYPKGSIDNLVSSFENRTIYSTKAAGDDILDTFRVFAQNDYYDLPSNTGPIWDSFVSMGTLYLHTTKSLWRTFAEQAATLSGGNIEDVVLGTGNLFARPSQEMVTTEGGYAGTISQFGGVHSPIGYLFPDVLQGKILGLVVGQKGGLQLKEMSRDSISTFCHKEFPDGLISDNGAFDLGKVNTDEAHLIDNPYMGIGFNGGYDNKLKRVWITKQGTFTLSYSAVTNNWISYHSYQPQLYIPYDNRVFMVTNNDEVSPTKMWEMNTGEKGQFFEDAIAESSVEIIARSQGTGVYNNLVIDSESTNAVNLLIRDDNFNTLQVFTDRHNTGIYNLVHGNSFAPLVVNGESLIKYRNNEYRVAIPRDSVINNDQDIFEPTNLENISQDRERIKGDYAHIRLVYNNLSTLRYLLKNIKTIISQNIR